MPQATKLQHALEEVGREVGLRKSVYRRWVQTGRLSQGDASKQLEGMEAAYTALKALHQAIKAHKEGDSAPLIALAKEYAL